MMNEGAIMSGLERIVSVIVNSSMQETTKAQTVNSVFQNVYISIDREKEKPFIIGSQEKKL